MSPSLLLSVLTNIFANRVPQSGACHIFLIINARGDKITFFRPSICQIVSLLHKTRQAAIPHRVARRLQYTIPDRLLRRDFLYQCFYLHFICKWTNHQHIMSVSNQISRQAINNNLFLGVGFFYKVIICICQKYILRT